MTTPDQREQGIRLLVQVMTDAGVSPEDAEKAAPMLVDKQQKNE